MTIGQLAKIANLSIHTLRYYESLKVIPKPARSSKGYRKYSGEYVKRIQMIKKFQELGFTLKEIKTICSYKDCRELKEIAIVKLTETQGRIRLLKNLEKELLKLIQTCPLSGTMEECPVIQLINKKLEKSGGENSNMTLYKQRSLNF